MEEQHRLEIASRITELREKSRWTQPEIADQLGLSLRGYQKIEEKGTSKFERAEEIAEIHGVDPNWIWDGEERKASPDPFATGSTATVGELRAEIRALRHELLAEIGKVRTAQEALLRRRGNDGRSSAGSRK
jgi:transcriptional regulator with XRE-family HTH domain